MTDYVQSFTQYILAGDSSLDPNVVQAIVTKCHAGNGYFSWDGILDDLTEIVGHDRAVDILRNSGECSESIGYD